MARQASRHKQIQAAHLVYYIYSCLSSPQFRRDATVTAILELEPMHIYSDINLIILNRA